jgi:sulfate adenylyltransferase (ADP) / ATP adenylyltransferase
MSEPLLPRIDRTLARAIESGALLPISTERETIRDAGLEFSVRWVSSLAKKDSMRVNAALRRDPDYNPFLPPEPDLTIGAIGAEHLGVLNKYPVIDRHLLIVTRAFELQTEPLGLEDFTALALVMTELGGLGFYNGGTEAGASQRHKHLQWIPDTPGGARLAAFAAGLPGELGCGHPASSPALPWRHRFVRIARAASTDPADRAAALLDAFRRACDSLGIASERAPMPPYNLLTAGEWLVVVPRSREQHEEISVNALGFAGSLFVRHPEQIDVVRRIGPLRLLAGVGLAG